MFGYSIIFNCLMHAFEIMKGWVIVAICREESTYQLQYSYYSSIGFSKNKKFTLSTPIVLVFYIISLKAREVKGEVVSEICIVKYLARLTLFSTNINLSYACH